MKRSKLINFELNDIIVTQYFPPYNVLLYPCGARHMQRWLTDVKSMAGYDTCLNNFSFWYNEEGKYADRDTSGGREKT